MHHMIFKTVRQHLSPSLSFVFTQQLNFCHLKVLEYWNFTHLLYHLMQALKSSQLLSAHLESRNILGSQVIHFTHTLAARWSILSTTLLTASRISVLCCRASVIKKEVTSPGAWRERREIYSDKGKEIPAETQQKLGCMKPATSKAQKWKGHGIWKMNNVGISQINSTGSIEDRKFLSHVTAQCNKSKAPDTPEQQKGNQNRGTIKPQQWRTASETALQKQAPRKVQFTQDFTNWDDLMVL